jgi:outer membrane lipoprotein SlyB
MSVKEKLGLGVVACVLGMSVFGMNTTVLADGAGAFIGGVLAAKVVGNMRRQTEAQEEQAYYARQQAAQPVPQAQAPAQKSAEQRIAELDKLAAGGYITPEEYKSKKKAIIDGM